MNTHIRSHDSATVNKVTLTTDEFLQAHRSLRGGSDGRGGNEGRPNEVRPGPVSMESYVTPLMDEVLDMKDIDARIEYFNTTVRGRSVLDEIRDTSGVVHQFFLFIHHAFGLGALPKFRSAIFVVSRKDKTYFAWKSNGLVMFKKTTDNEILRFFVTAYEVFDRIVLKYPIEHPESSHLLPGEARLMEREFTCVPYALIPERKYAFIDLLLKKVSDPFTMNALKRFEEHHILMSICGR
jgi:hypothetical protein